MKTLKLTIILSSCIYMFGCASGAQVENMDYRGDQKNYSADLKNNLDIDSISGGTDTNPGWTSEISNEAFSDALKKSLMSQGLFSENGKYQLDVKMLKVEQPLFGFDMTVTTHVQYTLTDNTNNKIILDTTIVAPHTATVNDAFAGVKRLRLANEGSGKKNIEGLLNQLSELKINPTDISLSQ